MTIFSRRLWAGMGMRAIVALALFGAAAPSVAQPVQITDALDRTVTLKSIPQRLIVTFNYEEFTAIGGVEAWKKVVAMSREPWAGWRPVIFARYSAVIPNLQAMPDVGHVEDNTFSAEKVIAAKPDAILMSEWGFSAMKTQMAQIEAAGIPIIVIDYNAQTLERHLASTRAIGRLTGQSNRAEELAMLYEREYRDILARISRASSSQRKKKVYVELGRDGPDVIGNTYNNTMWGKIITTLGAENLATNRIPGAWAPLNAETVLAENPDVILLAGSSWLNKPLAVRTGYTAMPEETRASLRAYAGRLGWSDLTAVREGRLSAIEHGLCRTLFDFVAMQYIAKALYPDAFADIDPEKSFREYHMKYLPVAYAGTWFLPLQP